MNYFELLPPASLGEFSITMRGEDEFGTKMFIESRTMTPPVEEVDIDVDLDLGRFDRIGPDYLQTTKGIPIFSERFISAIPKAFASDVITVPAILRLRGGIRRHYHAGRLKRSLKLIDAEASSFSDIRGIRILTQPHFKPVAQEFYMARDSVFRMYMVASETLVRQTKVHQLNLAALRFSPGIITTAR